MGLLLIGAVAGGFSGAAGYLIAGKIHGKEKIEMIYPAYAALCFAAIILAAKFANLNLH